LCWGKAEQSVRLHSAQFGAAEFQRSACNKREDFMVRKSIPIIVSIAIGLIAGYAYAYHKVNRERDKGVDKLALGQHLSIAGISGAELLYLKDPKEAKAFHFMKLHFCQSVDKANEMMAKGITPFVANDNSGLERGRQVMVQYGESKCVSATDQLLGYLAKFQH
jgi:hypothetical protein